MHAVYAPEHRLMIPMASDGTISYNDTRLPTKNELTTLPQVKMTSELPWDPKASHFAIAEKQVTFDRPTQPRCSTAALNYISRGYENTFKPGTTEPRHVHATQQHMMSAELVVASDPRSISAVLL